MAFQTWNWPPLPEIFCPVFNQSTKLINLYKVGCLAYVYNTPPKIHTKSADFVDKNFKNNTYKYGETSYIVSSHIAVSTPSYTLK